MTKTLPRLPSDHVPPVLRDIARKLDAGTALGGTEPAIAAVALRAAADGRSVTKALTREGPHPRYHLDVIAEVDAARETHGSLAEACRHLAKQKALKPASIERQYRRARHREREIYRQRFRDGALLPGGDWGMTDDEITEYATRDAAANMTTPEELAAWVRRRRDAERAFILDVTGWRELPNG